MSETGTTEKSSLAAVLDRSYRGRRVLVTGHNGFVGSWLCHTLARSGAEVTGFSLAPEQGGLGESLRSEPRVRSIEGDVRDLEALSQALERSGAEIVFHLAAQALVLASYEQPVATFATNVMGTAHILEAVRIVGGVAACVVVTSDKCYAIGDGAHGETDPLGGEDPYSASKAAAELVAHAYRASFSGTTASATRSSAGIATTRAGNIVGGGDWSAQRIVPDCARALGTGEPVVLRRPDAIRPWQHVLDAVAGYVRLGDALSHDKAGYGEAWNFGPPATAATTVGEFVAGLLEHARARGIPAREPVVEQAPATTERTWLTLDSTKAHCRLGWAQVLDLEATLEWTLEWYAGWLGADFDPGTETRSQIERYLDLEAARTASSEAQAGLPGARP